MAQPPNGSELAHPGFAVVHRRLREIVERTGRAVTVRVDDADLGPQVFSVGDDGARRLPPLGTPIPPGLSTVPAGPPPADAALVTDLVAATVQAARANGIAGPDPELELRRVPGVYAVVVDGNRALVRSSADAPPDVADQVAAVLAAVTAGTGPTTVDLVRDTASPWGPSPLPTRAPGTATLLATRHRPHDGEGEDSGGGAEWEIHLGDGPDRSVGRAPAALGPTGAADATLRALVALGHAPARLVWARLLETTRDHRFVIAVALDRGDGSVPGVVSTIANGIASGADPLEATARATLDAHGRP